jgi:hypothetical protein
MKPTLIAQLPSTTHSHRTAATPAQGSGLSELIGALPIVIFYRAVREVLQQRRHRQLVLQAFRR